MTYSSLLIYFILLLLIYFCSVFSITTVTLCLRTCVLRVEDLMKLDGQYSHLKGLSPVWDLEWSLR